MSNVPPAVLILFRYPDGQGQRLAWTLLSKDRIARTWPTSWILEATDSDIDSGPASSQDL